MGNLDNDLINTAEELFIDAMMEHKPLLIVEGIDDAPFYSRLCEHINLNMTVMAVENIKGYTAGNCDNVISAIKAIQDKTNNPTLCKKYALGIIDRDARFYRGEDVVNDCILILKFYSYETHLITRNNLKNLIKEMTKVTVELIDDNVLDFMESDLQVQYEKLYYSSLEALKAACIHGYVGVVQYGADNISFMRNPQIQNRLNEKRTQLENFARSRNISFQNLKYIVKGKWILALYVQEVKKKIAVLHEECKAGRILQCQFCKNQKYDNCLYKMYVKHQENAIKQRLNNMFDDNELEYIYERLRQMQVSDTY